MTTDNTLYNFPENFDNIDYLCTGDKYELNKSNLLLKQGNYCLTFIRKLMCMFFYTRKLVPLITLFINGVQVENVSKTSCVFKWEEGNIPNLKFIHNK